MLYVFHGSDISKSGDKARALVKFLRAKKPDAAYVVVNADDWNSSIIEEHLGGQSLFSNKYIIFLDRVTENAEAKEKFGDFIFAMNESPNIFIASEGKINAELKKAFEKSAEKVVVTDPSESAGGSRFGNVSGNSSGTSVSQSGKRDFNIFALADALGSRDSFKAWSLYRQAIDSGIETENIIGTLFWQAKSMILASQAKTATESGLNPFVFGKSKKYAANYSATELNGLVSELVMLYHNGHRGIVDLELAVERLILCALWDDIRTELNLLTA